MMNLLNENMKGISLLSTLFAVSLPSNTSRVKRIVVTETFHLFKTAARRFLQCHGHSGAMIEFAEPVWLFLE